MPTDKGKTIWEMLMERIHGSGNGAGIAFYNPLDLRIASAVPIAFANGPEFAERDFAVQEIREFNRRIGGQEYRFTDYLIRGVSTKSFDADQTMTAKIRAVPNQAGAYDALLLKVYDEFEFSEDFLNVVKDTTGIFEVTDDKTGEKETFTRLNNLKESYQAAVLAVSATTPDGKAAPGKTTPLKIEYWDYWRDSALGGGKSAKEFMFAEMNSDTGWFQLWRGREFFTT